MELGSLLGLLGGIACIILSIYTSGGEIATYIDPPSFFMTCLGSYCALLIQYNIKDCIEIFKILGRCFKVEKYDLGGLIAKFQELSERARREGLLALEEVVEDVSDPFMKNGLKLVVDGSDQEVIRALLENELAGMNDRHAKWLKMIDAWAKLAPGFGMLGTVLGLIAMMKNLEDKSRIGPNMAVALITTFYGAIMANFLLQPMMGKLAGYDGQETVMKSMIIEGVLSIQAGDNPRILTLKLLSYLEPKERHKLEADLLKD